MQAWVETDQMQNLYVISLYVSIVSMFGGIGTIGPHALVEAAVCPV